MYTSTMNFEYVILGGGNAAGYACQEFVKQGVGAGKIAMICAESTPPYERPALTKAYLHPPSAKVRARLPGFHTCVGSGGERQTVDFYKEKGIELIHSYATYVNAKEKSVQLHDGRSVKYQKLIVATGTKCVRLSKFGLKGDDLAGVHYLREEHEAAALVKDMEALGDGRRVVIVGGGFIGVECAAALSGWGIETTMVFPEEHVMPRLFNAELASWFEDQYKERGVKFIKGDTATEFVADSSGRVSSVLLKSGQSLAADLVVVGVGAQADLKLFDGLEKEQNGLKVDSSMKTSDSDIFAVGDIASFPSMHSGEHHRQEHVAHARQSAAHAVQALLGVSSDAYRYLPYYYSRVFEYTDKPIVFNFFGDRPSESECHVKVLSLDKIAAAWVAGGKVVGALLMGVPGPSPDDAKKLREFVESNFEAGTDVAAVLSERF